MRASLVLTTINTKYLRDLLLEKKHGFSFIFLNFHFLSFIQQLQICNIANTDFGAVQSKKVFHMTYILDQPTDHLVNFRIPEYLHLKGLREHMEAYLCLEMQGTFYRLSHLPQCHQKLSACRAEQGSSSPDLYSNTTSAVPCFLSCSKFLL